MRPAGLPSWRRRLQGAVTKTVHDAMAALQSSSPKYRLSVDTLCNTMSRPNASSARGVRRGAAASMQ